MASSSAAIAHPVPSPPIPVSLRYIFCAMCELLHTREKMSTRRSDPAFERPLEHYDAARRRRFVAHDECKNLTVRHAAWRNTRRWLLDKTQSVATIFAVAKSTCAKKRISVNRFCSSGVSPWKGFVIFIVDPLSFLLRPRKWARVFGWRLRFVCVLGFVISRQIFALRRQSHERRE
jgi:hypothetical protein